MKGIILATTLCYEIGWVTCFGTGNIPTVYVHFIEWTCNSGDLDGYKINLTVLSYQSDELTNLYSLSQEGYLNVVSGYAWKDDKMVTYLGNVQGVLHFGNPSDEGTNFVRLSLYNEPNFTDTVRGLY